MRKIFLSFFLLLPAFLFSQYSSASGPVFWRVNTRAEIEKGDAKGIAIADNGTLTLAPQFAEVYDTKQAYVWSAVADARGNVYLGTGHEGRVFKVDGTGKGALLYKTAELDVMALAVDNAGNIYAGTSPDGKVYRIAPSGEAKVFFEPKTKYIWSLAFDAQGRLLVGTGDKGVIFRVNPDGTGAAWVNTTQTNITALRVDAAGNVIAGTDPGGMVLRIGADGKAFTLFDAGQREIRDLVLGSRGEIYALALSEAAASGGGGSSSSGGGGFAKAALYRLDGQGGSDVLWESKDVAAFAIALRDDNQVLVGTGQKGRIYGVANNQKPALLTQSTEAQTARFVKAGNVLYAASTNLGKLFRLGSETEVSGTYTSSVREAATGAAWGRLSWLGEGEIELQTRSGNTAVPDGTWGEWSAALTEAEGGAITSAAARYLQWRATLKKAANKPAPRLREVVVSYLPRNVAPKLNAITVLPSGTALAALPQPMGDTGMDFTGGEPGAGPAPMQLPPRKLYQRGALSLQWQAEDRNGDTLEYAIFYRSALGVEFYPLKAAFRDSYYTVDANALPDGRYVFKVVVNDGMTNPGSLALRDELESEPVEIDNTPPAVASDAPKVASGQAELLFRASDGTSILRRAEYQLDGNGWKAVFPVDGIADGKREEFSVKVTLPDARPHVVALRVYDASGNVGSAQVSVK
ncbi:MAG: hypothetical protein HOP19_00920 [Acidobacteria bacterium]|nr:hypothetical protein [Acidobacteriota bacterium]